MYDTVNPAPPLTRLSEDEEMLRANVRAFAAAEVAPLVREMDEQAHMPRTLIDKLVDLGVMAVEIPEKLGGAGGHFFLSVIAVEELARVDPSVALVVDVQNTLVINALLRWGSDDFKDRFLPRLAAGAVGAYALSEAGSGSDAFALATRADADGDDYVLNGRKLWAQLCAEEAERLPRRNRAFPAPRRPGRAAKDGCASSAPELRTCRAARRWASSTRWRRRSKRDRPQMSEGALDHTLAYVQERKQFGQPISAFQGVQFQVISSCAVIAVETGARPASTSRPSPSSWTSRTRCSSSTKLLAGGCAGAAPQPAAASGNGFKPPASATVFLPRFADLGGFRGVVFLQLIDYKVGRAGCSAIIV